MNEQLRKERNKKQIHQREIIFFRDNDILFYSEW